MTRARTAESLEERRQVIAEVLAALQRIGRHAPPALMLRPEDALHSVRSAMMLGAVLPEMRSRPRRSRRSRRARAAAQADRRRARQARRDLRRSPTIASGSSLLIDERQKQQAEVEKALADERQRAARSRARPPTSRT